jgi:arsenate reductase
MAEGLLQHMLGSAYDVFSAGTKPSIVRPEAIAALAEIGIDISHHRSKSVDEFTNREIDFVLTVCDHAKQACPFFPAKTRVVHHSFDDPPAESEGEYDERLAVFRRVRDEIADYFGREFVRIVSHDGA